MKFDKLLITLALISYCVITTLIGINSNKLLIVFLGISVLIFFITKLRFEPFRRLMASSLFALSLQHSRLHHYKKGHLF